MINKHNVLGKQPFELGQKDAVHAAIVSVRTGEPMEPGAKCAINEFGEAVVAVGKNKSVGIADPFLKSTIKRNQWIWLVLNQDEISAVRHDWDHPTFGFSAPTREPVINPWIKSYCDEMGVTFEKLMEAADSIVYKNKQIPYVGTKTLEEIKDYFDDCDSYDFWSAWADESLYEFENQGTECCPEYDYPNLCLFSLED